MIERYSLPKMSKIWSEQRKFSNMLKIELLAIEAQSLLGNIPRSALPQIRKKAKFDLKRIQKLETSTKHDVVAFVANVGENLGKNARYLHIGLTSSDLLDTTLAWQMKDAADILIDDLKRLSALLKAKAHKYKWTVCVARTHGIHAEPTSFGLKLALWFDETKRNLERLQAARNVISVGKISGAVGTYANIEPFVQDYICKKLKLKSANISTQVIQRDRHAQFLTTLSIIGSSLEKFAFEIRHLQRTEVAEIAEPFYEGQKGSSAMPHKRNPVLCERICGLSRVLRANALASLENIALWHERDISHSSAERIIIPDSSILLDYILNSFIEIVKGLTVNADNMKKNLNKSQGLIFSQRVMLSLMEKGLSRNQAYDIIQRIAMRAFKAHSDFKGLLSKDKEIKKYLTLEDITACFDVQFYLRFVDKIFKKVGI